MNDPVIEKSGTGTATKTAAVFRFEVEGTKYIARLSVEPARWHGVADVVFAFSPDHDESISQEEHLAASSRVRIHAYKDKAETRSVRLPPEGGYPEAKLNMEGVPDDIPEEKP